MHIHLREKGLVEWIETCGGQGEGVEKNGWQGNCMRGVLLSRMAAVFMIGTQVSQIFGDSNGTAMQGGTLGWVVNLGSRYLAGIGWLQIF